MGHALILTRSHGEGQWSARSSAFISLAASNYTPAKSSLRQRTLARPAQPLKRQVLRPHIITTDSKSGLQLPAITAIVMIVIVIIVTTVMIVIPNMAVVKVIIGNSHILKDPGTVTSGRVSRQLGPSPPNNEYHKGPL